MGMLTDACPSCGCYPEAADMLDAHVRYIVRERDEARADAARWKAEAERLREDMKHALMVADETASMQCECDGYYRCGSCPTRIANRAEDVAEILKRSLDNDWGSALSAGGGTDA